MNVASAMVETRRRKIATQRAVSYSSFANGIKKSSFKTLLLNNLKTNFLCFKAVLLHHGPNGLNVSETALEE